MTRRGHDDRLRVAVLGYLVRGPLGGMAWAHLQFLLGLHDLGHEVWFVEDSDDWPSCYDPSRETIDTDPTYGLRWAGEVLDRLGLGERWAYYDAHRASWHGPAGERAPGIVASADIVLNLGGVNPLRAWSAEVPVRVLVDGDPVFTQVRHLTDPAWRRRAEQHTAFFTYAENVDRDASAVPDDGLPWQGIRQPIVLRAWPERPTAPEGRFTTVMQWSSYPPVEYEGVRYGLKADSLAALIDLPTHTGEELELVVTGAEAPLQALRDHGWHLREPGGVTAEPWSYRAYVGSSKGEFSVAKHGYVATRSGWFSERSAAYLASGRPVVVEETGFSDWMGERDGVVPFTNAEEAAAGLARVGADYRRHCLAARPLAAEIFDPARILTGLLERAFASSG